MKAHTHDWQGFGEPVSAGSSGFRMRCTVCQATTWQRGAWDQGRFVSIGEPRILDPKDIMPETRETFEAADGGNYRTEDGAYHGIIDALNPPTGGKQGEGKMAHKRNVDLDRWLGTFSPSAFSDLETINNYFTVANCREMWPGEKIDEAEMEIARLATIDEWKEEMEKVDEYLNGRR